MACGGGLFVIQQRVEVVVFGGHAGSRHSRDLLWGQIDDGAAAAGEGFKALHFLASARPDEISGKRQFVRRFIANMFVVAAGHLASFNGGHRIVVGRKKIRKGEDRNAPATKVLSRMILSYCPYIPISQIPDVSTHGTAEPAAHYVCDFIRADWTKAILVIDRDSTTTRLASL